MSGQHALNERNRLEAEMESMRAERDKWAADRDKEIRHYSDKWKDMGAKIDALTARVEELQEECEQQRGRTAEQFDRAEAAERALDKADAFVGSCTVSEDLADAKISLTLMLNYCEARAAMQK